MGKYIVDRLGCFLREKCCHLCGAYLQEIAAKNCVKFLAATKALVLQWDIRIGWSWNVQCLLHYLLRWLRLDSGTSTAY